MNKLRNHRLLARWVLLWFVLFVGASVAAPIVSPQASTLACGATGMKWVDVSDSDAPSSSASLHCPLCLPMMAPPGAVAVLAVTPQPEAGPLPAPAQAWRVADARRSHWPRGPPAAAII